MSSIFNELFRDYLNCKFKTYLKVTGHSGRRSNFETMNVSLLNDYRRLAIERLVHFQQSNVCERPSSLQAAIRQGYGLITDAHINVGDAACHFDALVRTGKPLLESFYYPVLFVHSEKKSKADKMLLAYCGSLLKKLQNTEVTYGKIMHSMKLALSRVQIANLQMTANQTAREIVDLQSGGDAPPMRLNDHCQICEFRERCHATAVDKDDLSLLRGLSEKEVTKLNNRGISTVTQYSHTFRPRRTKNRKRQSTLPLKHNYALQSCAVRDKLVYVTNRPKLPRKRTRIYFDVEGIPDRESYYLIGAQVVDDTSRRFVSFWADNANDESLMWGRFVNFFSEVEDCVVFHYGSYDSRFVTAMTQRYGGNAEVLRRLHASLFNALSAIYGKVYFPVLSNDLKTVASWLGQRWSADDASGLQSIIWRMDWEKTRRKALKQTLIQYNRDDCSALEAVVDALNAVCDGSVECQSGDVSRVVNADDLHADSPFGFGKKTDVFPEFARINNCAYFDYQRDRVHVRTNETIRKIVRRKQRKSKRQLRINKTIVCTLPDQCHCGSKRLAKRRTKPYSRTVVDLKFSGSNVKRWVTRYTAHPYKCRACGDYTGIGQVTSNKSRFGHNLCMWCVYGCLALRHSNANTVESLGEMFGVDIDPGRVSGFKRRAAQYYTDSYEALLARLRDGRVIHADETWVPIAGHGRGYVWTFANVETAVYVYSDTREGSVVEQTLEGFRGVLVSDFYAGYDSMECPQQKCHIHLMRDMNDDVLKHPFDDELKRIGQKYGVLLGAIVESIDRYGLKRRHLNKHRKGVDKFYREEIDKESASEIARSYQKRMSRYRDKLFTFLDHDGVPWNNNNAENAVKSFVSRRKIAGTSFARGGIRDYVVLLSVYQTLRYRNASFLKFLLSGAKDVDEYCAMAR